MDKTRIVRAAMHLRTNNPPAWDEFVLAVRELAANQAAAMVSVPPDHLNRAQGMAQYALELSDTFQNVAVLYDKMTNPQRK